MELSLSPEQEEIRKLVRDFAEREVKPRAEAIDHNSEFPRDLVDKAAKLGLLGIPRPDAYGGAGLDHLSFAIFVEEIARFCASTAVILDVHTSVAPSPSSSSVRRSRSGAGCRTSPTERAGGLRADRARGRLRCRASQDDGGPPRRWLRPQGHQDLHHQRRRGGTVRRDGVDNTGVRRGRHHRVPGGR